MDRLADIAEAQAHLRRARELLSDVSVQATRLRADAQWATPDAAPVQDRLSACARLVALAIDEVDVWARDLDRHAELVATGAAG